MEYILPIITGIIVFLILNGYTNYKNIKYQRCLDCEKPIRELQRRDSPPHKKYCECHWKVYPPKRPKD